MWDSILFILHPPCFAWRDRAFSLTSLLALSVTCLVLCPSKTAYHPGQFIFQNWSRCSHLLCMVLIPALFSAQLRPTLTCPMLFWVCRTPRADLILHLLRATQSVQPCFFSTLLSVITCLWHCDTAALSLFRASVCVYASVRVCVSYWVFVQLERIQCPVKTRHNKRRLLWNFRDLIRPPDPSWLVLSLSKWRIRFTLFIRTAP